MPIAKMMGRMGKMAGKGATAMMKDKPAGRGRFGRMISAAANAEKGDPTAPKRTPMMGSGLKQAVASTRVNASQPNSKKFGMAANPQAKTRFSEGGMADKTGRAMKKTTADAKGRAMKKGK